LIVALTLKEFQGKVFFMETLVDDIGSFPLPASVDRETYDKAYRLAREALANGKDISQDGFLRKNFYDVTINSFRIKVQSGLDVANTPWHYDGIRQVSDTIHKTMEKGTFIVDEKDAFFPEVRVIEEQAKRLSEEFGKKILLRVCMFGPMEQYLAEMGTKYYSDVLDGYAETIRRFAKNSILNNKYIKTKAISIDEPSFGIHNILATPDVVCKVLERAFDFQGVTKQIHLHSASGVHDLLYVKNIDVLSFEYAASPKNIDAVPKRMLKEADKQIRVGISRTDIDSIWAELAEQGINKPSNEQLVESEDTIRKRFKVAKEKYGETMTFTGPDCGLHGWPTQDAAQTLLKRTVEAVKTAQ
jgi:5-methyltetrahydropteroyltriglutamate--homocysteine methyltransferase